MVPNVLSGRANLVPTHTETCNHSTQILLDPVGLGIHLNYLKIRASKPEVLRVQSLNEFTKSMISDFFKSLDSAHYRKGYSLKSMTLMLYNRIYVPKGDIRTKF